MGVTGRRGRRLRRRPNSLLQARTGTETTRQSLPSKGLRVTNNRPFWSVTGTTPCLPSVTYLYLSNPFADAVCPMVAWVQG